MITNSRDVSTGRTRESLPYRAGERGPLSAWVVAPLTIGAIALTAACGYSGPSSPSTSGQHSGASGTVVSTASTGIGTVLVNGEGRTVYEFANDRGATSACTGTCAAEWPPVPAPASLPTSLPDVSGELGVTMRDDGSRQLTIASHPVYTFAGDNAPGQTNGNGIQLNGGLWSAALPSGAPLVDRMASSASSSSTTY